jgi:replication initiation and membrane attachment protein DnaB
VPVTRLLPPLSQREYFENRKYSQDLIAAVEVEIEQSSMRAREEGKRTSSSTANSGGRKGGMRAASFCPLDSIVIGRTREVDTVEDKNVPRQEIDFEKKNL